MASRKTSSIVSASTKDAIRCDGCYLKIEAGKARVIALDDKTFHPQCFVCTKCQKEFPDGKYIPHRGRTPYCAKCYSFMCPTCEKIIDSEYVTIGDGKFHEKCVKCSVCRLVLDIHNLLLIDDVPYCKTDYEAAKKPPTVCHKCKKAITGYASVKAMQKTFHPECFVCTHCKKGFDTKEFIVRNDQPYCERCANNACTHCGDIIDGEKSVTYQSKKYHKRCFKCRECGVVLDTSSFLTLDDIPLCEKDYERLEKK